MTATATPSDLTNTLAPVKVGDIFTYSWGYDQTNVDYYEVVGVTPSGKSVRVRQIAERETYDAHMMTGTSVPVPGKYIGPPLTKRLVLETYAAPRWGFKLPYSDARPWNSTPQRFSSYA